MGNLRPFQIILFGVFGALAVGGLIFFSLFRGGGGDLNPYGTSVEVWGTVDRQVITGALTTLSETDEDFRVVSYAQKDPRTFQGELVNAIAEGRGPDLIILPHDLLLGERAKIFPISYEALSDRDFRDAYVEGANIFQLNDGTYGLPLFVDPLVMYWNRDVFASAGLATPPSTWEEVVARTVPAITRYSEGRAIARSTLAFGEYRNIEHAKEVLLTLLLQSGSRMVVEDSLGAFSAPLDDLTAQTPRPPATAALDFYTQFADPGTITYTWNRSLPQDRNAFLSGDLALYFGFGSEVEDLSRGNANLNFDVTRIPQGESATLEKGYGQFYSLALLRSSDNPEGAYQALFTLGQSAVAGVIAEQLGFAPVHRASLAAQAPSAFQETINRSALIARGWLDPDPDASQNIFGVMIEDVTSGRQDVGPAVTDAVARLNQLLR